MGVFIDLSKAFDTVDHQILLAKLNHYGVRGILLKWFESYLSDRKQLVNFNSHSSSQIISTNLMYAPLFTAAFYTVAQKGHGKLKLLTAN